MFRKCEKAILLLLEKDIHEILPQGLSSDVFLRKQYSHTAGSKVVVEES